MGTWPLVLLVTIIIPIVFRNSDPEQKLRVRTALKVVIALWALITLVLIARVGYTTHWANSLGLLVVFSIPLAITVGAYVLMVKRILG